MRQSGSCSSAGTRSDASTEFDGRGAARPSSFAAMGSTRAGSAPMCRSTSRASSYALTAPWFVTCQMPERSSSDTRTSIGARSAARVGILR
jgi:hypothetical protein